MSDAAAADKKNDQLTLYEQLEKIGYYKPTEFTDDDKKKVIQGKNESSIQFPKYREKYFKDNFDKLMKIMKSHTCECDINFLNGEILVSTSNQTYDPTEYFNGFDFIKLMSRGMDIEQAEEIFKDEVHSAIIPLATLCKNKKNFINRRNRLHGPNGVTLKAIQLLTKAKIVLQGGTMAVVGPAKGVEQAAKIATDAMNNIHPVLNINKFMVLKELENNPEMKGKDLSNLLPKVSKSSTSVSKPKDKKKVAKKPKKDKSLSSFVDKIMPQKSKLDMQIESGEYFLEEKDKKKRKFGEKRLKQSEKSAANKAEKEKRFIAPEDQPSGRKNAESNSTEQKVSVGSLKKKMKLK